MQKLEHYLAFVKEQVGVQQGLAKKYENSPFRKGQHLKSAKNLTELADFLAEIQTNGTQDTSYLNRGSSPQKRLLLTYEEIDGAPEELLKELNLSETDRQDLLIEYLIAKAGGILSLDKIMLQLWKKSGEVPKRNTLTSRLYRMAAKGMIYNVPGKKGVYSTYEVTEDEAKKLFGNSIDGDAEETSSTSTETTPAPSSTAAASKQNPLSFRRGTAVPSKYLSSTSTTTTPRG
jgi:hypothetical protein